MRWGVGPEAGWMMDVENCRQLIEDLLSSYVDRELDAATAQSLELHVQMCPPCAAFLRTFLASRRCARAALVAHMPPECEDSLWSFLRNEVGDEVALTPVPGCPDPGHLHAPKKT